MDAMKPAFAGLALAAAMLAAPAFAQPKPPVVPNAIPRANAGVEERLSEAVKASSRERRKRVAVPSAPFVAAPRTYTKVVVDRPNVLAEVRARHATPHDRADFDPAARRRSLRQIDALCQVLTANTRRTAGLSDAACANVKAALSSPKPTTNPSSTTRLH